ncbi:MAG: ABC transporter ATP-binding protein [Stappiaceae bacterium]
MSLLFELTGISYAYPERPPALSKVDLSLSSGERLGLEGHNGAGKSTLLKIMVGLIKPASGRVRAFDAVRQKERDFLEVRQRAGLLFQDADDQLFCPTVVEDIAFGPLNLGKGREEALSIVDRVLHELDLSDFRDRITHKLSGGEKRLVALATILAMDPDVLLLDEPTTALDEKNAERMLDILKGLPMAMVIVSHDRSFRQELSTRSMILEAGQLA